MEETSIHHLVTQHPALTFIFCAIFVVSLTIVIGNRLMNYWERRQNKENKETSENKNK